MRVLTSCLQGPHSAVRKQVPCFVRSERLPSEAKHEANSACSSPTCLLCPSAFLAVSLSLCLSVSLPLCLSASLPLCLSASLPLCLSASLSLCLSVSLSLSLSLSLSHSLSLSLCLSLSISLSLSLALAGRRGESECPGRPQQLVLKWIVAKCCESTLVEVTRSVPFVFMSYSSRVCQHFGFQTPAGLEALDASTVTCSGGMGRATCLVQAARPKTPMSALSLPPTSALQ